MPKTELIIDCEEIYLRKFHLEDAHEIARISHEPGVSTFLPDWKASEEQRLYWLSEYELPMNQAFIDSIPAIGDHMLKLAIVHKESNRLIGWCCTGTKHELPEPNREVVYAVSSTYQKRGYATNAVRGLTNYLFSATDTNIVNAIALTHNDSSTKVIQKCGFKFVATIEIEKQLYNHFILQK